MIEIYFNDLTEAKQQEILEALGDNGNYDVIPIATIPTYEEADEKVKIYPCDCGPCPYGAIYSEHCRVFCGLGVDENEEEREEEYD